MAVRTVRRHSNTFGGLHYNGKVFMAPPWKQIDCTDTERNGDFDHAIEAYGATVDAYLKCGYSLIELPRVPPDIRASFVMEQISALRNWNQNDPLPVQLHHS